MVSVLCVFCCVCPTSLYNFQLAVKGHSGLAASISSLDWLSLELVSDDGQPRQKYTLSRVRTLLVSKVM